MQEQDVIIGLDIGTTSTKTVAFDSQGQVVAAHSEEYPLVQPSELADDGRRLRTKRVASGSRGSFRYGSSCAGLGCFGLLGGYSGSETLDRHPSADPARSGTCEGLSVTVLILSTLV
jgi:predicted NBD/HSP70 family sugar kinase